MSNPARFNIGETQVGDGALPFIVAEVAQGHDGSLGMAHAYVDAIAEAGAHAVKFQTHIASAESSPNEPWRVKFSRQDASRYDYWKRMEFTETQWSGLADHARNRGITFLSTPFSFQATELLEGIGMPAWKVGSGEVTNLPLLSRLAETEKPVLLSSGMSTWAELDAAVATVRDEGAPVGVFQCTSLYPCPPEKVGLNVIGELRERYGCPVGLSDHTGALYSSLAAAALGADIIEVHVVLSKKSFGPDVPVSLTLDQLQELVTATASIHESLANPLDKDKMAEEMAEMRRIFGKHIAYARPLEKGHLLSRSDVIFRKPAEGIPPARVEQLLGRKLTADVNEFDAVREDDLD